MDISYREIFDKAELTFAAASSVFESSFSTMNRIERGVSKPDYIMQLKLDILRNSVIDADERDVYRSLIAVSPYLLGSILSAGAHLMKSYKAPLTVNTDACLTKHLNEFRNRLHNPPRDLRNGLKRFGPEGEKGSAYISEICIYFTDCYENSTAIFSWIMNELYEIYKSGKRNWKDLIYPGPQQDEEARYLISVILGTYEASIRQREELYGSISRILRCREFRGLKKLIESVQ